jgi:hypothetical protein
MESGKDLTAVVVVTGFGLPVNVLALFWSVFMVVNVGWPRTLIYSEANRFAALSYTILLLVVGASYFWLLARMREPCRQRRR